MYRLVLYYLIALLASRLGARASSAFVPHDPDRDRLLDGAHPGRLLAHQPRLRARLRRARQPRVGLHHRPHPGADHRAGRADRRCAASARWSSPRSGRWPRSSSSPSAASTSSIRPPSASSCRRSCSDQPATWWVGGNLPLLPVVLIGGVLIVRKLQRFDLVATFILVALGTVLATTAPAQLRHGA